MEEKQIVRNKFHNSAGGKAINDRYQKQLAVSMKTRKKNQHRYISRITEKSRIFEVHDKLIKKIINFSPSASKKDSSTELSEEIEHISEGHIESVKIEEEIVEYENSIDYDYYDSIQDALFRESKIREINTKAAWKKFALRTLIIGNVAFTLCSWSPKTAENFLDYLGINNPLFKILLPYSGDIARFLTFCHPVVAAPSVVSGVAQFAIAYSSPFLLKTFPSFLLNEYSTPFGNFGLLKSDFVAGVIGRMAYQAVNDIATELMVEVKDPFEIEMEIEHSLAERAMKEKDRIDAIALFIKQGGDMDDYETIWSLTNGFTIGIKKLYKFIKGGMSFENMITIISTCTAAYGIAKCVMLIISYLGDGPFTFEQCLKILRMFVNPKIIISKLLRLFEKFVWPILLRWSIESILWVETKTIHALNFLTLGKIPKTRIAKIIKAYYQKQLISKITVEVVSNYLFKSIYVSSCNEYFARNITPSKIIDAYKNFDANKMLFSIGNLVHEIKNDIVSGNILSLTTIFNYFHESLSAIEVGSEIYIGSRKAFTITGYDSKTSQLSLVDEDSKTSNIDLISDPYFFAPYSVKKEEKFYNVDTSYFIYAYLDEQSLPHGNLSSRLKSLSAEEVRTFVSDFKEQYLALNESKKTLDEKESGIAKLKEVYFNDKKLWESEQSTISSILKGSHKKIAIGNLSLNDAEKLSEKTINDVDEKNTECSKIISVIMSFFNDKCSEVKNNYKKIYGILKNNVDKKLDDINDKIISEEKTIREAKLKLIDLRQRLYKMANTKLDILSKIVRDGNESAEKTYKEDEKKFNQEMKVFQQNYPPKEKTTVKTVTKLKTEQKTTEKTTVTRRLTTASKLISTQNLQLATKNSMAMNLAIKVLQVLSTERSPEDESLGSDIGSLMDDFKKLEKELLAVNTKVDFSICFGNTYTYNLDDGTTSPPGFESCYSDGYLIHVMKMIIYGGLLEKVLRLNPVAIVIRTSIILSFLGIPLLMEQAEENIELEKGSKSITQRAIMTVGSLVCKASLDSTLFSVLLFGVCDNDAIHMKYNYKDIYQKIQNDPGIRKFFNDIDSGEYKNMLHDISDLMSTSARDLLTDFLIGEKSSSTVRKYFDEIIDIIKERGKTVSDYIDTWKNKNDS